MTDREKAIVELIVESFELGVQTATEIFKSYSGAVTKKDLNQSTLLILEEIRKSKPKAGFGFSIGLPTTKKG